MWTLPLTGASILPVKNFLICLAATISSGVTWGNLIQAPPTVNIKMECKEGWNEWREGMNGGNEWMKGRKEWKKGEMKERNEWKVGRNEWMKIRNEGKERKKAGRQKERKVILNMWICKIDFLKRKYPYN